MTWDWKELIAVVAAAAIGWVMRHLNIWLPPTRPDPEDEP